MTIDDKLAFTGYLAGMAEIYDVELTQMKINLYFEALKDLSVEQFIQACNYHTQTARFFPKPSEIREAIAGDKQTKAIGAFTQLIQAVREYGAYKSVEFEDRLIMACVQRLGGWIKLCDSTTDEWKWIEKDFYKLYQAMEGRETEGPAKLVGITEQGNANKGLKDGTESRAVFIPAIGGNQPKKLSA